MTEYLKRKGYRLNRKRPKTTMLPKRACFSMDAYSRKMLSMKPSNTLDRHFCVNTRLEKEN